VFDQVSKTGFEIFVARLILLKRKIKLKKVYKVQKRHVKDYSDLNLWMDLVVLKHIVTEME
jgi:hypothetical protein